MSDTSLERRQGGGNHPETGWNVSRPVKRATAIILCSALAVLLGVVFTRVIAARVPQQRATLEKLIAERTGLSVRFDNVRFAWNLDGASAVFTRVELTDPAAGRVRVVAPELRVELDTWDFLRHQQFSFGHVTLSSPDIDIIGDADGSVLNTLSANRTRPARGKAAGEDEATLLRRQLAWAELMPVGRIEVEGARVHLVRRGERVARHSFTLSQAVVSRGPGTFNAWGTMLLAQDVGQSLFVSAKLDGLRPGERVSGEMRFIARRVFLERLPLAGLAGRGTLDATLRLRDGRVESANWQGNAREVQLTGHPENDDGAHFDHLTANGQLTRAAGDLRSPTCSSRAAPISSGPTDSKRACAWHRTRCGSNRFRCRRTGCRSSPRNSSRAWSRRRGWRRGRRRRASGRRWPANSARFVSIPVRAASGR